MSGKPESRSAAGPVRVIEARSEEGLKSIRRLLRAYAEEVGVDLAIDGFEQEVASLPGRYAPPTGRLLLAVSRGRTLGCVALRGRDPRVGEVKRLYVSPNARGLGVGLTLARAVIECARRIGYRRLVLDTLPTMVVAQGLYESLGFRRIPAYRRSPFPGTVYYALDLRSRTRAPRARTR